MTKLLRRAVDDLAVPAFVCAMVSVLVACSGGAPEAGSPPAEPPDPAPAQADDGEPGDVPVVLAGILKFSAKEEFREGTPSQGMSYSRHFDLDCTFRQRAWTWINPETGTSEYRLREQEPGVLKSEFTGGASATGDSVGIDIEHTPHTKVTSSARLRGALTKCHIQRIEPAQFGSGTTGKGYEFILEFDASLTGSTQTTTVFDDTTQVTNSPGYALVQVLERPQDEQNAPFHVINSPSNIGDHLHASPLQIRPPLGARPTGDDPEIKLSQEIYDGIVAHPESAWLGVSFDAEKKLWTFDGSHETGARAKHHLHVEIRVVPEQEG